MKLEAQQRIWYSKPAYYIITIVSEIPPDVIGILSNFYSGNFEIKIQNKNTILIDCEKNDLTVTEWITKKLVAGEVIESQEPPKEQTIGEIKQSLHNNPQFKDSFKKPEPAKRGRPFMIEQRGNSNSGMSNQEVFKMIDRYHAPDKVIQQTEVKVDAAETKIKSLETIMNLFLKGIINTQELESLKKGILNK